MTSTFPWLVAALLVSDTGADVPSITVQDARAELKDGRLSLWIRTSGPLELSDARARVDGHMLKVTLDGARVRRNRAFSDEGWSVWAQQRNNQVDLQVPLVGGVTCARAVHLRRTSIGLEARASCSTAEAPVEERAAPSAPAPTVTTTATRAPPAPVELAPPAPPAPQHPAPAMKPMTPLSERSALAPGPGLGMAALLGLGAVGFLLARRRRQEGQMVEVLQTHALGPRRSIMVARVAGQTLVLSNSEAGIQLLTSVDAKDVPPTTKKESSPLESLLAGRDVPSFDDLLAESDEDQALRRKLAAGRTATTG
ncbi:MAG: flagellar biosynthetic protein FliO [Myxococcota bacterium]